MKPKTSLKDNLDVLSLSDVYSLMLFIMYKVQDIPEYAVLSELCYLLDGRNINRLLTYFAGKTIKVPTREEFVILTNALLMYQYINIDGKSFSEAQYALNNVTAGQKDKITELYLKLIPIIKQYNIDRGQVHKNGKRRAK